ncbi:MAG: methionine--tRNA ligase [Gemmatimonadetes bacterium]|nr:methionine--tRNA ligase [Gemmatimonadota bacterium]
MSRKFTITTAIDYVNAKPHLGHAYEKITADAIARAHRALGRDVFFLIGNDEHGTKIEKSAAAAGVSPQEWVDRMAEVYQSTYEKLLISWDGFIRTTEERHHSGVREILARVRANGWIRRDKYTGWYCEGCEAFYTEKDLVDGKCPNHDTEPRWVEEENWFFRLSDFRDRLLAHIRENPGFIRPESRRNEVVAFLEGGLEDLSISRAGVKWGIPFPEDPNAVVYVWFDALTNYISGVGFGTDPAEFARRWPASVHVVGKDITRFHCVIWPAMLMAADIELPECVFGHGFIYQSGTKMSKSLGNIVNPLDVVDVTGADALRYFLIRELTYGKDGDFSWDAFIARYNAELANDLGNLVKRTTDMTARFLGGEISAGADTGKDRTGLRADAERVTATVIRAWEDFDLSGALESTWSLVRRANQVIQEKAPWELAKDDLRRAELTGVLDELLEAIRIVAELAAPAIPGKTDEIRARLGLAGGASAPWTESTVWRHRPGWRVAPGDPVFPRIDRKKEPEKSEPATEAVSKRAQKKAKRAAPAATGPAASIGIEQFRDVELRVATVLEAVPVEGADRLLQLTLDLGDEKRQVVSGIARHYAPEDLPGRQVIVVANLAPATIRGVESRGMILAAESGGRLALLAPGHEVAPGTRVS